jgi:DNA-binding response OmpR family regulator
VSKLAGRRVMVVEDEYYLAMDVATALTEAGAEVAGPFADYRVALKDLETRIPDCAVLDVNLGEGPSFDLPRILRMRTIPFLFFTGYDASAIPAEFAHVPRLEKPVTTARLLQAIADCCRPVAR